MVPTRNNCFISKSYFRLKRRKVKRHTEHFSEPFLSEDYLKLILQEHSSEVTEAPPHKKKKSD